MKFMDLVNAHFVAANVSSDSAHQRWPIHRKSRNAGYVQPIGRLVLVQPSRLQDRSEPTAQRHRSGPGPRLPPRGPIRKGRASQEHRVRGRSGLARSWWACGDPEHLPHNLWDLIVQRRRLIHGPITDLNGPQEAARSAPDRWWVGQVHRWLLLRRHFGCYLGLLPPLCLGPSLLHQVICFSLFSLISMNGPWMKGYLCNRDGCKWLCILWLSTCYKC